jgi:hypothetical protein
MEPEGSLPHSQAPATCPYPEPAQSNPHTPIPLPEDPSYYIYIHWQIITRPQKALTNTLSVAVYNRPNLKVGNTNSTQGILRLVVTGQR